MHTPLVYLGARRVRGLQHRVVLHRDGARVSREQQRHAQTHSERHGGSNAGRWHRHHLRDARTDKALAQFRGDTVNERRVNLVVQEACHHATPRTHADTNTKQSKT